MNKSILMIMVSMKYDRDEVDDKLVVSKNLKRRVIVGNCRTTACFRQKEERG